MKLSRLVCIFLIFVTSGYSQDTTQTASLDVQSSGITVSARLSTRKIPLNRPLSFIVQVEWYGDLDRYEISEVENPSLQNFTVVSNSSSDRREMVDGKVKAIKTFEFELEPQELGMGYVDGVIVKYIDTKTGEGKHLMTNRLEAKVIDPLPEPGEHSPLFYVAMFVIIVLVIGGAVTVWYRKRLQAKRAAEVPPPPPIEEVYLDKLKLEIPLNAPVLNVKDGFASLSKLYRHYLAEKFDYPAANALVDDIVNMLSQSEDSERLIDMTRDVLNACDVVKFSGSDGDRAELERLFTMVESALQAELKAAEQNTPIEK